MSKNYTKEKAKKKILALAKRFGKEVIDAGKKSSMNEEQVKQSFLNKLFKYLGWNMHDENEVLYEHTIKGRYADYLFRLNNQEVFIVEAKRPSVNLKTGTTQGDLAAKQAINYAWHKNINFAVLTDFEELRVFHALERPKTVARNLAKHKDIGVLSLEYDRFEEEFDKVWLLSRESVENGLLDACLSEKDKRVKKTVDEAVLSDLLKIRTWLAKDIKKRNGHLSTEKIGELVQRWINRFIFIRTTEDRGLEKKSLLLNLATDAKFQKLDMHLKAKLLHIFKDFDKKYNSKLFAHLDLDDSTLIIDQKVLIKAIKALYYGTDGNTYDRYEFDLISPDLLGRIYEQYLGIILRTTEKRAKLEAKKSKRKKMGIYYTPSYIVDYIVKNTIGEALKGKSLEEISKFKIVDPATGSGSFLLRAFDEVCKFVKERIEKGDSYDLFDSKHLSKDGTLSLGQKIKVLRNNIYGVDLDQQAIEICKLSLLLKLLEHEGPDTKKRVLPVLDDNLQVGNSLIDDSEIAGDKAFKWKYRFKDVFKQGGFDVVVGNPPWVQSKNISDKDKEYYADKYKTASRQYDLFTLFIELGTSLVKDNGLVSFITPDRFLTNIDYKDFRKFIVENHKIKQVIYLGDGVFEGVNMPSAISIYRKGSGKNTVKYTSAPVDLSDVKFDKQKQEKFYEPSSFSFKIYQSKETSEIIDKINNCSVPAKEILDNGRGVEIGKTSELIVDKPKKNTEPFLVGSDIDRYQLNQDKYITLGDDGTNYKSADLYKGPKLLVRKTGKGIKAVLDKSNKYVIQVIYVFKIKKDANELPAYVLALLNSKLMRFYYFSRFGEKKRKTFPHLTQGKVLKLPIAKATPKQQKELAKLADRMLELNKRLQDAKTDHKKEQIKRQIASTDAEIDDKVYKLYGLTKKDIEIVENG